MFQKLKYIKDLRSQAKKIENVLGQERLTVSESGITITILGTLEVESVALTPEAQADANLPDRIRKAINEAVKKAQRMAAQKLQASGDLKLPGFGKE